MTGKTSKRAAVTSHNRSQPLITPIKQECVAIYEIHACAGDQRETASSFKVSWCSALSTSVAPSRISPSLLHPLCSAFISGVVSCYC